MELLKKTAKMDVVHVLYKGAVPGFIDLVASHVAMMFTSVFSTQSLVKSGRVRMLAVGSAQRSPSAPEIPTIAESGYPGFEVTTWWGLLGPAAMPRDVVGRLNAELVKIMTSSDARERIGALGADLMTQIIRESGARVD